MRLLMMPRTKMAKQSNDISSWFMTTWRAKAPRCRLVSNERLRSSFERWFGERGVIIDEHESRLRALESWRETAEKKNGQQ